MSYTKSEPITLVLEADEDGNLDLVDCYDDAGNHEGWHMACSSVGWVREDWANCGPDMLGDDELLLSARLVVRGYSWLEGPDRAGEYDGGFEIDKIIERKPMIKRFSVVGADGNKYVNVTDCPGCHMTHVIPDDKSQKQVYECGDELVVVYVEDAP
jgi:hypothetical protein